MSFFPGMGDQGDQYLEGQGYPPPQQNPNYAPVGYGPPHFPPPQNYGNYGPAQPSPPPQLGYAYQGGYNTGPPPAPPPPPLQQYGSGYGGYQPQTQASPQPHQNSYNAQPLPSPTPQQYQASPSQLQQSIYNTPLSPSTAPQQYQASPSQLQQSSYNTPLSPSTAPQQYQASPSQLQQSSHNTPLSPSTAPQQFGHGAPSSYAFQYSNCTGRRKALLIGINYFGQRGQLRGCINDVKNMSTYLNERFGYAREDMVILTDDQHNPMSQPTKANILRAMHWLVKDAQPNDSLFFHYSGHGGQTPDLDGDEEDGYDEVIYPVDFRTAGHIVDDEMHRIMVKSLPPGCRLTAIFDSCHSGSALDLPYIYSTQGVLKEPNLAKEAGAGLLSIVSSYARGDIGGIASTAWGFLKKAANGDAKFERAKQTKTSPADVIMWSGSKDTQKSQDANIGGEATGAMSWAFINALKKNPQQSYVQLLNSIRDELASRYTQKPQLSSSHPLNTDLLYVM